MDLLNGLNSHERPKPARRKRRRGWLNVVTLFSLAFILGTGAVALYAWQGIMTPASLKDEVPSAFVIERGESVKRIAAHLAKEGFVRRAQFFEQYVWLKGYGPRLQAGEYALRRDMTISEIAEIIVSGLVVPNEVTVTFPEGFGTKDMDKTLVEAKLIGPGEFLNIAKPWEGYLFPDTYRFPKDASATTIRDALIANFKKKWTAVMRQDAATVFDRQGVVCAKVFFSMRSPLPFAGGAWGDGADPASACQGEAIVILASLIEKEVRTPEDMKMVSGILWKRLSIGMALQVDASIVYLTSKKTGQITRDDLEFASPYNTYQNRGLPPAPIANPGLNAIMAAIYPAESDNLFYLSKPDGETVFSRTLEEHNIAKAKYLK